MNNIDAVASTYHNEKIAEKAIGEGLKNVEDKVESWLEKSKNKPFSKKEFEASISFDVGYGIKSDGTKINKMDNIRIYLSKSQDGNVKIVSSYPIDKLKN